MDTGIHKIHLFHASDLHFHFSTNTKARWWILKFTKQVKCWIRCIYHCTKHQPQQREGVLFKAILYILYINNKKWIQTKMTVKYSLYSLGLVPHGSFVHECFKVDSAFTWTNKLVVSLLNYCFLPKGYHGSFLSPS